MKFILLFAAAICFASAQAEAQSTCSASTGNPSTSERWGSNDGTNWALEQSGQSFLYHEMRLTNVVPPDAGVADSGAVDSGSQDSGVAPDSGVSSDAGSADAGGLPPYSGGTCPTLIASAYNNAAGDNAFLSSGIQRTVRLVRIGNSPAPAIIFSFHSRNSQPGWGIDDLGLVGGNTGNYIVVAPAANGNWNFQPVNPDPGANPDIVLFDDLLACVGQRFGANRDKVSAAGFSAGGLFVSYLLMHRSEWLSAVAIHSGGLWSTNQWIVPLTDVPAMVSWGGTTDTYYQWGQTVDPAYRLGQTPNTQAYYTHSFHLAATDFVNRLVQNGHYLVQCNHGGGHQPGPVGFAWPQSWPFRFLYDATRGMVHPYRSGGIPAGTMPTVCR